MATILVNNKGVKKCLFSVSVDESQYVLLKEHAVKNNVKVNAVVKGLIRDFLKKQGN